MNVKPIRADHSPSAILLEALEENPDCVLVFMMKDKHFKWHASRFPSRLEVLGALELAKMEFTNGD